MSNLVIVAIPAEDDPVWKISSEKIPHMTILFLGNNANHPNKGKMLEFLLHAANTSLSRFGLDVDRRGTLGEDEADVLFFQDSWELPRLREFRSQLLRENNIRSAYDSAPQFEGEWNPHLTLGYPSTPAREDKRDYPGINWVNFDRVAMWDGDYAGTEIILKRDNYYAEPVGGWGMSTTAELGREFLIHFGVKGMKWGVRRSPEARSVTTESIVKNIGKTKVKSSGGENHPATEDALRVAGARQKIKKSGMHALSNDELREVAMRLNLEQQVKTLEKSRRTGLGQKFLDEQKSDLERHIVRKASGVARKAVVGI